MAAQQFCVVQLDGWAQWWDETRRFRLQIYISIFLFFLSAVLANPIARSVCFVLRRVTPARWIWPDDAKVLMMWQTSLLCRAGLLWIALRVSRLSIFLCQWPSWLFGICFIIWMDAGGNVLREVIVRKGLLGYSESEKPGRLTLLYEGTTLTKMLLLVLVIYTYYFSSFIEEDNPLRLASSTGFFVAVALSVLPLLRNVMGARYMFLSNMLHLNNRVRLHDNARGTVRDAPLGFLVLESADATKTFVPAGGTATSTTTVFGSRFDSLLLKIPLPSHLSSSQVRSFVQELDLVVSTSARIQAALQRRTPHRVTESQSERARSPSAEGASKLLLDLNLQEEVDVLDRARGCDRTISVLINARWLVQFHTFIRSKSEEEMLRIRAMYVEEITRLTEKFILQFGG